VNTVIRGVWAASPPALHLSQHPADVLGGHVAVTGSLHLKLFQNPSGLSHRLLIPGNVDRAVAGGNRHAQRFADLSQVLITGAEDRQQFFGVDHRNSVFAHPHRQSTTAVSSG
jgi:hypothetical protein